MPTAIVPFTRDGFVRLKEELTKLKSVERGKVIEEIAEARAHGDLSENAEYHAAKDKQGFIEARIAELDDKISRAQVIEYNSDLPEDVRFGAHVSVQDEATGTAKRYQIVGDIEADIAQGKISMSSPIARALMGKRVDDIVEVKAPKGTIEYLITAVDY